MVAAGAGASLLAAQESDDALSLALIGRVEVVGLPQVEWGGLSGFDYDPFRDDWVAISDARTTMQAYRLQVDYDATAVRSARVTSALPLTLPAGVAADGESIRLDPTGDRWWIATEGEANATPISEPALFTVPLDGQGAQAVALPPELVYATATSPGLEANRAIEGLTFTPDGADVLLATEAPFPSDPEGGTRIFRRGVGAQAWDARRYDPDPVASGLASLGRPSIGVSEILATTEGPVLVLERSGAEASPGHWVFAAKLYSFDYDGAGVKRLLYDFSAGGGTVDNLEGLAWGRPLPDGRRTLLVLSDDNFSPFQHTQLWVLAVNGWRQRLGWNSVFAGVRHDERMIAGFVGEYRWLSNYYPCAVTYEGRAYRSSEAAYHASKFAESERDGFTTLGADDAKKLSRKLTMDTVWWDARKRRVMGEILLAKFEQNTALAEQLIATGERELIELNWWKDRYWGVYQDEGENVLGHVLMEVRAKLANP